MIGTRSLSCLDVGPLMRPRLLVLQLSSSPAFISDRETHRHSKLQLQLQYYILSPLTLSLARLSFMLERSPHSLSDTQVDGNLTLGENLADHGGLSMALEAYTNWRNHNTDVKLPALPFNDMQLFFIGKE